MKKLSLMLVFVMLLVAMLALSVFAEDPNIIGESTITVSGGDFHSCIEDYWKDGDDYTTSNGPNTWCGCSAYIDFDNEQTFTKLHVVLNGPAKRYNAWGSDPVDEYRMNTIEIHFYTKADDGSYVLVQGASIAKQNVKSVKSVTHENLNVTASRIELKWTSDQYVYAAPYEIYTYGHECNYIVPTTSNADVAAGCETTGVKTLKCVNCNNTITESTPVIGHNWDRANGEVIIEATEESEGLRKDPCLNGCGKFDEVPIPKLNHVHKYTEFVSTTTPSTCTTQGEGVYKCTCGDPEALVTLPLSLDANNHKFTVKAETITPATYREGGLDLYKCEWCNEATTEVATDRLPLPNVITHAIATPSYVHNLTDPKWLIDGDPSTGTSCGHSTNEITFTFDFGEVYEFEEIVILCNSIGRYNDIYNDALKWETTSNNVFDFTVKFYNGDEELCSFTKNSKSNANEDNEVVINFENNIFADKMTIYVGHGSNNRLGFWEVETYAYPKDEHTVHEYNVLLETITPATCGDEGLGHYKCRKCDLEADVAIPATGKHTWTAASCTAPRTCSTCKATDGVALGHGEYSWQKGGCEVCGELDKEFYKIVEAKSINDIKNAPAGSIVRLQNDLSFNYDTITNAITLDLCGHKISTSLANGGMIINNAEFVLVNGTIEHSGAVACLRFKAVKKLEGLTIEATKGGKSITGGFQIQGTCTNIESINNITFKGDALGVGIEIASGAYVKEIDNVTISVSKTGTKQEAQHQHLIGIIVKGKCDSISNSTITASYSSGYTLNELSNNTGIYIENGNAIKLSNCTVNAEEQAIYANSSSTNLTFENTTFGGAGALINSSVAVNGLTDVAVATIGNKYFATLEKAIAAANADETVKLVKNIDLAKAIEVNKKATIDLNGMELTVKTDTAGNGVFMVVAGGELTINATGGGVVDGVGNNIYNIAIFANGGNVIINGGTFTNVDEKLTDDHYDLIYAKKGGIVEIYGGTFIAQTPKWTLNVCDKTGGSFIVKGGTFQDGFNPGATETEPNGANNDFIPAGYYLNGNTVVECTEHNLTTLTCTEDSVCTICQYVAAKAQGHIMADATCTAPKTCTECGATEGAALGHSWQNATCTTPKTCTVCKTTEGEALGHQSDVPATCQNKATCKVCGQTFGNPDPNTHTSVVTDAAVAPTCTATGLTAGSHCSACDTVIVKQQTIDKLPHTGGTATCTEKAICSECNQPYGEFAAHTYGTAVCLANTCVNCGYVNSEITADKHTYGWNIGTDENGNQKHGCSVCFTEAKKDKVNDVEQNYSTNLGFKIYYVSTWSEFTGKVNSSDAAVVRFTADATTTSAVEVKNGNVIIDLGKHSVTSTAGSATFHLNYAKGLVNGTLLEGGAKQAVSVRTAEFIKDFVIEVLPTAGDCSGIIIFPGRDGRKAYLGLIENVTITAKNNGIETYETITGIDTAIGTINGVTVTTQGQALTLYSNVGLIKNSTFTGKNFAVIFKYLNGTVTFENCTLSGDNACLYVNDVRNNPKLVVDSATTFATKGLLFYASDAHKESTDFGMLETAVAAVNGRLYATFTEAFAALKASNKEVTEFALMANLELTTAIEITKNVNFSLGGGKFEFVYEGEKKQETKPGYTITMPNDTEGNGAFWVKEGGVLTISGNGTINSVGANDYSIAIFVNGGKAIINGGTFTNIGAGEDDHYDLIYVKGGELVVNGGTFKAQTPKWTLNLHDKTEGTIVVNGGVFFEYNPAKSETEPNGTVSFLSDTIKCVYINADGAYALASEHLHNHTSQQTNTGCIHTATAPTCTEYGYLTHACVCGDVRIETYTDDKNKPLGHNFVAGEMAENGDVVYSCSRECGVATYTINNKILNGTYFDSTALEYVFADGVLTVMGRTFNYTYNVTEGMVTTNDATVYFNVANGVIYFKGAETLHTHAVENLITRVTDPTCTAKGYTTYICNTCGPLYTGNEVAAKGHRFSSQVIIPATCTEDAVLVISCGDCGAEFRSPSEETNAYIESLKPFVTIVLEKAGHKWTDATCTTPKTCSVCNATEGEALGHTPGKAVVENEVPATPTTAGSYDEVVYCVTCKVELSRKSVTVEPTCKHTNKEIIPAVLPAPSNNHTGKTEGLYCPDCDTILAPQQDITVKSNDNASFKINTAALALSDGITLIYKATLPAGYEDAYIVFLYRGEEEIVSTKSFSKEEQRYHFNFSKVTPQYMGEEITATMYAKVNGEYVAAYKSVDYSVRAYCESQLKKNISDKLRTLISDLLVYGAKAQIIMGVDAPLVTEGLTLTPSEFEKLDASQNVRAVTGTKHERADWATATLSLGSKVNMFLKFYATDLEGLQIKVTINDRVQIIDAVDCVDTAEVYNGRMRYTATFTNITAIEFGDTVTGVFLLNGEEIGRTVTYSVNSYIYANQDAEESSLLDLLKALYNYGKAAYNSVH